MSRQVFPLIAVFAALACSVETVEYDDGWGDDQVAGGKADGLEDLAEPLDIGDTATGRVSSDSIKLFRVVLQRGDELRIVKEVTDGDLSPHFTLFEGVTKKVSSVDFDIDGDTLVKTYEIEETAVHVVAVRAFQNQGAGAFDFTIHCDAGPCAGDFPGPLLADHDADECLEKAQECAFDRMQVFNGFVGSTRAQQTFDGCLADLKTDSGLPCASACESDPDDNSAQPRHVCAHIVNVMPFFADQGDECLATLDFCMNDCMSLSDNGFPFDAEDDILEEKFSRCFTFGFNNDCAGFAADHETCGGHLETDSVLECEELCAATSGSWADDLSSACPGDIC